MEENPARFVKEGSGVAFYRKCPHCGREMDLHGCGDGESPPEAWECKPCRHVEEFIAPEDGKISFALSLISLGGEEADLSRWNWTWDSIDEYWKEMKDGFSAPV